MIEPGASCSPTWECRSGSGGFTGLSRGPRSWRLVWLRSAPSYSRGLASRLILVAALVTVPLRIVLHFAAGEVELPLFHPDDPVPTSEFLTGETIQAVFLLGIGMLMIRIAEMLRRGQAALSLVLDRQREINALKDRFVATVSHELRTPLTSLKGFTRTLLEDDRRSGKSSSSS